MECGQVQTILEAIASALVKDAEGNVSVNLDAAQTACEDLIPFIDCNNNHLPPLALLLNAIGEDACGGSLLKVTLSKLIFNGVWDDLPPVPVIGARLGATAPTLATFIGAVQQYTFDASNDYIIGSTEIVHGWKEGTIIYPHIHWATNGLEATAKGVQWQLKYVIGAVNEGFSVEMTSVLDDIIPANTPDRTHILSSLDPKIDGTNLRIGAYICFQLRRIATAHANGEPNADPFGIAVGFHGLFDTLGSSEIGTK